jgi:predicted O-linked N-acetylglucosamine transferase (SPINDLY family)
MMGVPVVTLAHPSIHGRHAASFLTTLGEPGWIAKNEADYAAIASSLVKDRETLARIRSGLRERLLASPVCDAKRFAGNLEKLLTFA